MQKDKGVKENSNASGGPFGFLGNMFSSIFGGKDSSDGSIFSGLFGSNSNGNGNSQHTSRATEPVIEELDSDAEGLPEDKKENDFTDAAWSNRNPVVELPEDQVKDHGKSNSSTRDISYLANHNKVKEPQPQSVSFKRVTYGGINGAYYTASNSRVTGKDGVTLEEYRQADRTTCQAAHRISRGINDKAIEEETFDSSDFMSSYSSNKGHSVTRKLDSDGKVETMQTLHNLNEDELVGFEQAWKSNADRNLRGWNNSFDFCNNSGNIGSTNGPLVAQGRFMDPFKEHFNRSGGHTFCHDLLVQPSGGRQKKVVTVHIE